jgi:hypothetical protein
MEDSDRVLSLAFTKKTDMAKKYKEVTPPATLAQQMY